MWLREHGDRLYSHSTFPIERNIMELNCPLYLTVPKLADRKYRLGETIQVKLAQNNDRMRVRGTITEIRYDHLTIFVAIGLELVSS